MTANTAIHYPTARDEAELPSGGIPPGPWGVRADGATWVVVPLHDTDRVLCVCTSRDMALRIAALAAPDEAVSWRQGLATFGTRTLRRAP